LLAALPPDEWQRWLPQLSMSTCRSANAVVPLRAYRFATRLATWRLHWPCRPRHARPQSLTSLKGPLAPPTLPADDQQPALAQARGGLFVSQSQALWSRADACW